jgi:hypothetical protein
VQLAVTVTVPRCVMTTLAQGDLPADRNVLRTISQQNSLDFGTEHLGQRGLDAAVGQARTQPEMTSDSSALVRVTPAPNSREQDASSVPRSFGRCNSTGPIVVITVADRCQPLQLPGRSSSSRRSWRTRPKNSSTSASIAVCIISRILSRATSSRIDARSRSETNSSSICARSARWGILVVPRV